MQNKHERVRDYILDLLESGALGSGSKLPGTREIARKLDVSFLIAQGAASALAEGNVLYSEGRRGTFVRDNWREQVVNYNVLTSYHRYPWFGRFKRLLRSLSPELRATAVFNRAPFEVRTTLQTQTMRGDYLELSGILEKSGVSDRDVISAASAGFSHDGGIYGLSVTRSPRVMFFNRGVFGRAGVSCPESGWGWDEFVGTVGKLKLHMPGRSVFHWSDSINTWMNVIMRSGGTLIDADSGEVALDRPATRQAIHRWLGLRSLLELESPDDLLPFGQFRSQFMAGEAAMFIGSRVNCMFFDQASFDDWGVVELPVISSEHRTNTQASEVLCVRLGCPIDMAVRFVETMLSRRMQDFLGKLGHGIPVVPASVARSIDDGDPRDSVFLEEMSRMRADYLVAVPPNLVAVVDQSMRYLWWADGDADCLVDEIAAALRTLMKTASLPARAI